MVNTAPAFEWTFCGVPDSSFVDGYDPDCGHYDEFNLSSSTSPNDDSPLETEPVPVALR